MVKKLSSIMFFCLIVMLFVSSTTSANFEQYINSGSTYSGSLSSSKDEQWYTFTTTEDNSDMYIYLSETTAPVRFNVYDSNKGLISNNHTTYFSTKKAGTYYIKVTPYYWGDKFSKGSYKLEVNYPTSFPDIQGHWAQKEIDYLVKQNLVGGYPNGTFGPDDNIRRSEAAAIIARELGLPLVKSGFKDVPSTHWASTYIGAAANKQIIKGQGGNEFKPDDFLTRIGYDKMVFYIYKSHLPFRHKHDI